MTRQTEQADNGHKAARRYLAIRRALIDHLGNLKAWAWDAMQSPTADPPSATTRDEIAMLITTRHAEARASGLSTQVRVRAWGPTAKPDDRRYIPARAFAIYVAPDAIRINVYSGDGHVDERITIWEASK